MIDYNEQQRDAASVRADMQKAYKIIYDAKTRYIKAKLGAKSKKQVEDTERLFADLADYKSEWEIQDHYGNGEISSAEYDRLRNLWEMREQYAKDSKKYHDRVIYMLEKAMSHIGDDYQDMLDAADTMAKENDQRLRDKRWAG